jgi:hypothetical protein
MEKSEFQQQITDKKEKGIDEVIARIKERVLGASNRLEFYTRIRNQDRSAFLTFPRIEKELSALGLTFKRWRPDADIEVRWPR